MIVLVVPSVGACSEALIRWVARNALICSGLLRTTCRQRGARAYGKLLVVMAVLGTIRWCVGCRTVVVSDAV